MYPHALNDPRKQTSHNILIECFVVRKILGMPWLVLLRAISSTIELIFGRSALFWSRGFKLKSFGADSVGFGGATLLKSFS